MQDFTVDQVELSQRVAMSRAQMEAASLAQKEQKRADRLAGGVPEGVRNGLRSCTVAQLRRAKKLCDKFILDQQHAPSDEDCSDEKPFIIRILLSIPYRNQRFRYEIIRSSKKAEKVYVNGPYWYRYWRDGKVVFRRAIGKKNVREMPRKAKGRLKEYSSTHDIASILLETRERYLCHG